MICLMLDLAFLLVKHGSKGHENTISFNRILQFIKVIVRKYLLCWYEKKFCRASLCDVLFLFSLRLKYSDAGCYGDR